MKFELDSNLYSSEKQCMGGARVAMKTHWLIPSPGEKHVIRFFGDPFQCTIAFYGDKWEEQLRIPDDMIEPDCDPMYPHFAHFKDQDLQSHYQWPLLRVLTCYVLDRADYINFGSDVVHRLRLFQYPKPAFAAVQQWAQTTGISPGGMQGTDWQLDATPADKHCDWRHRIFPAAIKMTPGDGTPFDNAEKTYIRAEVNDDCRHLKDLIYTHDHQTIRNVILKQPKAEWTEPKAKVKCPDCKGTKEIRLFVSATPCTRCDENGEVVA